MTVNKKISLSNVKPLFTPHRYIIQMLGRHGIDGKIPILTSIFKKSYLLRRSQYTIHKRSGHEKNSIKYLFAVVLMSPLFQSFLQLMWKWSN